MKKMRTILFIAATAILFVLISCQDPFLPEPHFPSDGVTVGKLSAPENITASQGEIRKITLSWEPNPKAATYYIYSAKTPLDKFVRCGETNSTRFEHKVQAGSTLYYRVSSVSHDGKESDQSLLFFKGTSIDQPLISGITDITESSAAVEWYMDNDDAYRENLLYTVYCYNGATEVAQVGLVGKDITKNRAVFTGLAPNTEYEYMVEAYLNKDQDGSEKSIRMNKATARRFRPGAPSKLSATCGKAKDRITLSFELPDMVDIALGDNSYDPKPLYFVIRKRIYSPSGANEYQTVCSYFGSIPEKAAEEGGEVFSGGYTPRAKVEWSDKSVGNSRGVKYEYQVQAYVDDTSKEISSDDSHASATGWALSKGTLSVGEASYPTTGDDGDYTSAELPLDFEFDPLGVLYDYVIKEEIEPIGDEDPNDPKGVITRETLGTYEEVRAYSTKMDLTQLSTKENPGRGIYSYAVDIRLNGETLDTVIATGKFEVSEDADPAIVENFRVQDGYTDKFVFKWHNYSNRKYILYTVGADGNNPTEIKTFNDPPSSKEEVNEDFSYSYSAPDILPGVTRYFAIKPVRITNGKTKNGQMVYYKSASQTLGVPQASLPGALSYSDITVVWTKAQKADTYRIKYRYAGDSAYQTVDTVKSESLGYDAYGNFKHTFKPEGKNIDITKAGKEIQVQVDALNKDLQEKVGSAEISTTSPQALITRLVGPALLNPEASRAASNLEIAVSWDKIEGADGYYVFRRQFNMDNTAQEGTKEVVYYVSSKTTPPEVTGKGLMKDGNDTKTVKAAAILAGTRYTLTDLYMPDGEYDGNFFRDHTPAYPDQQNDMIRGNPYRYYVVPVIKDTALTSIEFTYKKDSTKKNTDIDYYTIEENGNIKYSGAASLEKEGFTIGFGQDVNATKGTYSSNGSANDGIKVTWTAPPLLKTVSGFTPRYNVYRRYAINEGTWSAWSDAAINISEQSIVDVQQSGVNYQFMVGITNGGQAGGSDPRVSSRFLNESYGKLDDKGRPKMVGFMLGKVRLASVSRDARSDGQGSYGELVTWSNDGYSVDGYTVYLLNRNVNNGRQWIECDTVSGNTLNVLITNTGNRLKVLRDYKHYYKVRNYMVNEAGNKIYGPDPMPTYTWTTDPDPYVKWGARQVSADEFAAITALSIGTGMNWAGNDTSNVQDRHDAGSVSISESNVGYNREIKYSNSTPYFVTINGSLHGYCTATQNTPTQYGADCAGIWGAASGAKDHLSTLTFTGPGDVNGMYSGTVKILRMASDSGTGPYKVSYNGQNDYAVEAKHYWTCFTFTGAAKNYKQTKNFDWSQSGGIAGTSPDKWWYPVTGTRAGWD